MKTQRRKDAEEWLAAKDFRRRTGAWWKGRIVRLLIGVTTKDGVNYEAGTEFAVARKFGGLWLEQFGQPCIRRCRLGVLEILNQPPTQPTHETT